ncbi:MAG: lysophospholipid acyltransferase family protein [Planctomycetota bacterium]
MNKSVPRKVRVGGYLAAKGIRAWMSTLQYRAWFHDQANDPRFGTKQPRIYVFWHEYILIPLYLRRNCDLAMLLSRHKDADVLAEVARHGGFECVRGSSNKGAAAALLEMKRRGKDMHLTITPDGPRGPRRQLAIGPVYLASRLGLPIVPLGFGLSGPWRMNSWDQFALPRPFSRARGVIGPEIHVPPKLDREDLEVCRLDVERILTDLTVEAEDWAASGAHRAGEVRERSRSRVSDPAEMRLPSAETAIFLPLRGNNSRDESETSNRKIA